MPAYVIGIGGGSASGKSRIAEELRRRLARLTVKVINQDKYFLKSDQLPRHFGASGKAWSDHNHPDSFDFDRLRQHLTAAREEAADVVILEGILVLHDVELRELMDLKLFIDADPDERIVRRLRRNVSRGSSLDDVCDFYLDSVRYRHQEFCEPTRAHADMVIVGGEHQAEQRERLLTAVCDRVRSALGSPTEHAR